MGTVLGILAALGLAGVVATFALLNQTPTPLNFGLYTLPQARLHEVALSAAAAGALFSFFPLVASLLGLRRTVRALRRQVRALEEQVKTLHEAPSSTPLYSGNSSALAPAHPTQVARADEEAV